MTTDLGQHNDTSPTEQQFDCNYDDDHHHDDDEEKHAIAKLKSGVSQIIQTDKNNNLSQTHEGEKHPNDHGESTVSISWNVYFFALCAALNSCNLGYDIGVNTSSGPLLQQSMNLSDIQLEVFVGSLGLFAMIGAMFAHLVSDQFGRKGAFVVAGIFFILGVSITALSNSYFLLMFGRVFVGIGVGFGFAIDAIYIAEISPAGHRGRLVTYSEMFTNIGVVLGFSTSLIFYNVEIDVAWRGMFASGAIIPSFFLILVFTVMPESPRWLVQKGKTKKAREVLQMIYGRDYDVGPVLKSIQDDIKRDAENLVGWRAIIFPTPAFKRMLLVGLGIATVQQLVGIDAIQFFLMFILQDSGIESTLTRSKILIGLGVLKLLFIVISSCLLDRLGRRPLMLFSLGGCALALLLLAINFVGPNQPGFAILSLALYLSFFSIGIGPGAWLIPSEIFVTSIRAKGMSLVTFINRAAATLIASSCLSVVNAITWAGYFFLLFVVCLICLRFLYVYLPETKGRALEDMGIYFAEITGDQSILPTDEISKRSEANNKAENIPRPGLLT